MAFCRETGVEGIKETKGKKTKKDMNKVFVLTDRPLTAATYASLRGCAVCL